MASVAVDSEDLRVVLTLARRAVSQYVQAHEPAFDDAGPYQWVVDLPCPVVDCLQVINRAYLSLPDE